MAQPDGLWPWIAARLGLGATAPGAVLSRLLRAPSAFPLPDPPPLAGEGRVGETGERRS